MNKNTTGYRVLHFPLVKIITGIVVCAGAYAAAQYGFGLLFNAAGFSAGLSRLFTGTLAATAITAAYIFLYKAYEQRKITEFSLQGITKNMATGIALGALLQCLTILVMYANGNFSVISTNSVFITAAPLLMILSSAIFEEILLRGIIFRIIEEKAGSWIALVISALIFGALHLANPNSSIIAALGLAIQAGLLLAAAYMYARNLWFPIAIHFAWNFTQSAIFGANTSGNAISKSIIVSQTSGNAWITGGAFGPEGSVQATLFCLVATVILLALCIKKHKIIAPYRKNNL